MSVITVPPEVRKAILRFRDRFEREVAPIRKLLLFGSCARGDWDPGESDVDLLVLVDAETPGMRRTAVSIACREGLDEGILLAPKVFSEERFRRRLDEGWLFETNVVREGVPFDDAA